MKNSKRMVTNSKDSVFDKAPIMLLIEKIEKKINKLENLSKKIRRGYEADLERRTKK